MATTATQEKATLAVRIRNGQTSTGEWRYKTTNISGIKDDFGSSTDLEYAGALYGLLSPLLVGTVDGMRLVQTSVVAVS